MFNCTKTYKKFSNKDMLKIFQDDGVLFVKTNKHSNYIIRKKDLAKFIVLETKKNNHSVSMRFYIPGIKKSVVTTLGWYIARSNYFLANEFFDELEYLQKHNKSRKVKIFNNKIFTNFSPEDLGIIDGEMKTFDKLYKYYLATKFDLNIFLKQISNLKNTWED